MKRVVNSEKSFLMKKLERALKDHNIDDKKAKVSEIISKLICKMLYEIDEYKPITGPILPRKR